MKFRGVDGVWYQDEVLCASCGYHSADTSPMTCPVCGEVLGEHTVRVRS